jgi:ligand-binding sensor domain-containing protein
MTEWRQVYLLQFTRNIRIKMNDAVLNAFNILVKHLYLIHIGACVFGLNIVSAYGNSAIINPSFRSYKIEDGLSQSSVFAITQDAEGYIWFGTRDGLNRFDAQKFKVYRSVKKDSTSLNSNEINCLTTDVGGRLWVGTRRGLHLYKSDSDNFKRIKLHSPDEGYSPQESIRGILSDSKGNLWVLSGTRVYMSKPYNPFNFTMIHVENAKGSGVRRSLMVSIFEDSEGMIWISDTRNLYMVENQNSEGDVFNVSLFVPECTEDNYRVNSILEYPNGKLWMSTEQSGIILLDLSNRSQTQFTAHAQDANSLNSNKVRSAIADEYGNIWFGTSQGLSIFDPISNQFTNIKSDPNNPLGLNANSIISMYKDHSGTIWIGTFYGGVNLYNKNHFNYTFYKPNKSKTGLSEQIVSDIIEDQQGNLWIGTEGGGLNFMNRKNQSFIHITDKDPLTPLLHNNIKCLHLDKNNELWIGSSGGGISILDIENKKIRYMRNERGNSNSIVSDWIYSIIDDEKGSIWIGTYGKGLDRLNKETGKIKHYNKNDGPNSISSNSIRYMLVDSEQQLWIGTSKGLCLYNEKTGDFKSYYAVAYDSLTLLSDDIYCIQEDRMGNIWIGSYGGGLNLFNSDNETFTRFSVEQGLPGHTVYGILEDDAGFLWLSTNNGLARFDPKTLIFRNFDSDIGLPVDEYNYNSFFKSSSGELFFGGKNGLISFDPNQITTNSFNPNVVFTGLRLFNKPVEIGDESGILSTQLNAASEIKLKNHQNIITVEFSSLNFVNPLKNRYAYKLEGLNEEWIHTSQPEATMMNLSSGHYTLFVKGTNNDGKWNDQPTELAIHVLPPPWATWCAYLIYISVVIAIIVKIINFLRSRTNLRHQFE